MKGLLSGKAIKGQETKDLSLATLANGVNASQREHTALAVVLVQASVADGNAPSNEVSAVREMLSDHCGIEQHKISEVVDFAASQLSSGAKVDPFISIIKESFSASQRLLLLSYVWRVILSDGVVHNRELKLVNALAIKLGLDEESSEEARVLAESGRG